MFMMKKAFLSIAGAIALSLSVANAQEADRYVGAQHVRFQTACHPQDVKGYDTKTLRERFVMEKVMAADSILLTYSHQDPEAGELLGAGTRRRQGHQGEVLPV